MSAGPIGPVVVVGLGPVGATVALLLAHGGVTTVAIERSPIVFPHPRAVALDDEALRVLQAAGVAPGRDFALRVGGIVRLRSRTGEPLIELPPPPKPYGHPGLAFFHQPELEALLRSRLRAEPRVELRLGEEVMRVREVDGGVTLDLRDVATNERRELRAAYVLACDGARSALRRQLGIRLRGVTSGRRWLVVETSAPRDSPGFAAEDFEFGCDPRRPWVHGPLPHGVHRWEFMLARNETAAVLERSEAVDGLLAARSSGQLAILRAAVYTFHSRVASPWRAGRVLLLGDAAHLAPPFAGQGLGAGLRDAHNLAWKVAAVVRERAAPALLDSYEAERRPHVVRMTALAAALGGVVQARRRLAVLRDMIAAGALRSARLRGWVARGGWKPAPTLGGALRAGAPHNRRAGGLLPQPQVIAPTGERMPLDDALGPGFALLGLGHDPGRTIGSAGRQIAAGLGVRLLEIGPGGLEDPSAVLATWLGPVRLALIRPDRFVFGTDSEDEGDALLGALREVLDAGHTGDGA